jgi:hypothetical protein
MHFRTLALLFPLLICFGLGRAAQPPVSPSSPELWYWHHSYLTNEESVESSKALIKKAAAAGYTGVVFWDSSFGFMGNPTWDPDNDDRMHEVMKFATKLHMKVMALGAPYGWSNDVLHVDPNWAESERVVGTRFVVDRSGKRLNIANSFPGLANPSFENGKSDWFSTGDSGLEISKVPRHGQSSAGIINAPGNARLRQKMTLIPWREYHLQIFFKSKDFRGGPMVEILDGSDTDKIRFNSNIAAGGTHDWTELDYFFNSRDSTDAYIYLGVWGGSSGMLWFDDVQMEETALIYLERRDGVPLKIYDPKNPSTVYREGVDYGPVIDPAMKPSDAQFHLYVVPATIALPAGTHLSPGQTVAVDSYSVFPIPINNEVGLCLTEPAVFKWLEKNARAIKKVLPAGQGILMSYDEMRQMNSCGLCRAKNMTAGELLAWNVGQVIRLYNSVIPGAPLYVWSDMFDPNHNAVNNFYQVEGDLSGSWKGLPADVTIMNWNLQRLKASLAWFAGADRRQPIPHQQIIAGFYDAGTGDSAARDELAQAAGIPGIVGFMYTTYANDYSQLQSFATGVKAGWSSYLSSLAKR